MITDERCEEIRKFIVLKINESADAMWGDVPYADKMKFKALNDAYKDMYKRLFNEVYYDR